jgi:hypothetical protein
MESTTESSSRLGRVFEQGAQILCGLRGHDTVLHFERNAVMMYCASCGYRSPGWRTAERAPRLSYAGDAARHRLTPAMLERKTA